ncbi:uncharacterized protein LOC106013592 [Aplysia californica]|uniref:Uncharacterized protein LOC106013592 n=1 Tax=Aplysia californica TaxID=6500 RepID=A0ABM1ACS1_APLCA|nr:uncharacterized protein LOC106013592 [Aplysia californica]
MPRMHLRKCFVLTAVIATTCLLIAFLTLHRDPTFDYERGVPAVDPELWELLGPRPTSPKPPTTPPRPEIHLKQLPVSRFGDMNLNMTLKQMEGIFFRYLENKDVRCEKDQRLGGMHDGGWNVCLSPPYVLGNPCIVFSFGIGYDWQFDDTVSQIYDCTVLAFDPSMTEPNEHLSTRIKFKAIGVGGQNEVREDGWQMKTLGQHLKDEGYWGVPVDYVKIDIEYSEWAVLKTALREGSLQHVKQLGFEMHTRRLLHPGKRPRDEEKLDFVHMYETLRQLEIVGFRKFNYRKNPFGNYYSNHTGKERSCCYDLHYVNSDFFGDNMTVVHTRDSKMFH